MRHRLSTLLVFIAASPAVGQGICVPATNSHEANTFAILSVPVTFTMAGAPDVAHGVSIGLEVVNIPTVDRTDATPTACQPGKGPDNTNPIPGFVRPRVAVAVQGFVLEASWIPPVTVDEVKANLVGVAVERPMALGRGWYLGLRADAVFGTVDSPVVCSDAALKDSSSECFGGTRSNDAWQPGLFGLEGVVGMGHARIRPYVGLGYTMLQPRLQVDFTNAQGSTDRTRVQVNLTRVALFGGITARLGRGSVSAELYSTPADAVSGRLVLRAPVGR